MPVAFWYLFLFFLIVQGYFILFYFIPLIKPERSPKRSPLQVSVIICAKNEAENLRSNLPFILNQKYPEFEVLIMDDHSSDGTKSVIDSFTKNYNNLRYIKATDGIKNKEGKKFALSEAIQKAKFKHLLLTDADCRPSSLSWIEHMVAHFSGRAGIVLGIGQYNLTGKWFDSLIQYETFFTSLCYLGMAKQGKPYMGVGRNLAYQKRLFDRQIMQDERSVSGDDDLFIQNVSNAGNTVICTDERAQTFSNPPETYENWILQKSRHYSTAPHYRTSVKIRLLFLKMSFYAPNFLFICLLIMNFYPKLIALIFLMRWLFWMYISVKIKSRLRFMHPLYFLPWYEIYFSLLDLWIVAKSLRKKVRSWS